MKGGYVLNGDTVLTAVTDEFIKCENCAYYKADGFFCSLREAYRSWDDFCKFFNPLDTYKKTRS